MQRIRKGDEVIVIAGKKQDKGQRGKVLSVKGDRVVVEGINQVVKHAKPNPQLNIEGGRITKEASIHISNVMIFNPQTNKGDRVGFVFENDKKYRVFRSNGARID